MNKRKVKNINLIILPTIVIISFVLIFFQFSVTIRKDINNAAYADLKNTAEQQTASVSTKLWGQYSVLEGLANHIRVRYEIEDLEAVLKILKDFSDTCDFVLLGITTADGIAYTSLDGSPADISDCAYYQASINGKNAVEKIDSNIITGETGIVLSVPVVSDDGLKIDGVLFGILRESDFINLLSSSAYGDNTYSFIADKNGDIIVPSDSPNFLHTSGNIFSLYYESGNSAQSVENISDDLKNLNSGVAELSINGSERYIMYTAFENRYEDLPEGAQNLFLITSVPVEAVEYANSFIPKAVSVLASELLAVSIICLIYVFYITYRKSIDDEKETAKLRESEEMYRLINDFSDNIIFVYDHPENNIAFNAKYEKLFKHAPFLDDVEKCACPNPYVNRFDFSAYSKFINDTLSGLPKSSAEFRLLRPDGLYDWYKADVSTLFDKYEKPTKSVGRLANIQEHHSAIEALTLRAESDSLTKILNHISMKDKINRYLFDSGKGSTHAFLYIDLDNFKAVNDTMGHLSGDELLVKIAAKMQEIFRETDFVGRLGGDEFAVLIKDMHYEAMIHKKTQNLLEAISTMDVGSDALSLSCSIGVSIYSRHGKTFEELYRNADKALYKAKTIKNAYIIYDPNNADMQKGVHETTPQANVKDVCRQTD